jgi:hypothetical protein
VGDGALLLDLPGSNILTNDVCECPWQVFQANRL